MRYRAARTWMPIVVLGAWIAAGVPVRAADLTNRLILLMPELKQMAAPAWVKEGVRVSYYAASATLPADRFYYYRDAKGDVQRGDNPGPAGGGPMQYTCVAMGPGKVIGNIMLFVEDITTGVKVPSPGGIAVDVPGVGAVWANPQALARADRFHGEGLTVTKMSYPLDGTTYRALHMHYVSDSAVTDETYDLDSGVMLYYQHAVLSADRRSTQLAMEKYLGRRQTRVPGEAKSAPDWAMAAFRLRYEGAVRVLMQGSPVFPMPTSLDLRKTDGSARWSRYNIHKVTQGLAPGDAEMVCGVGEVCGGVWMPPSALQAMTQGQILDEDNVTGTRTAVEMVGPTPSGMEGVLISETCRGCQYLYGYDRRNGRMVYMKHSQQVGVATQETELRLVSAN
jgi:hypothetical protein